MHRLDNMVDVKNISCIYPGCKTQPSFGYEGCRAQHCSIHRLINMVDVRHVKCEYIGCKIQPSFGHKGGRA